MDASKLKPQICYQAEEQLKYQQGKKGRIESSIHRIE